MQTRLSGFGTLWRDQQLIASPFYSLFLTIGKQVEPRIHGSIWIERDHFMHAPDSSPLRLVLAGDRRSLSFVATATAPTLAGLRVRYRVDATANQDPDSILLNPPIVRR